MIRVELIFTVGILSNVRSSLQSKILLELFGKMVTTSLMTDKALYCLLSSTVSSDARESVLAEILSAEIWSRKLQSVFQKWALT